MPEVKYRISTGILPAIWLLMFHCRASLRPAGKGRIHQIDLVLLVEDAELDAGRVDERIGPGELDAVHAFLDREQAVLADHGDVFGVVDRKLRALAGGQGDEIHGGLGRCGEGQQEQKRPEYAAEHGRFPSAGAIPIVLQGRRVCQEARDQGTGESAARMPVGRPRSGIARLTAARPAAKMIVGWWSTQRCDDQGRLLLRVYFRQGRNP